MLAELDVAIFLKSGDDLERTAARVFAALGSEAQPDTAEDWGGVHYRAAGLGFDAYLYANTGDMLDPEFEDYPFGLEIMSRFWCVEMDTLDLEGPLSEYFARELAFELNLETATQILLETTEEAEVFEIRSFRRNPQYRLDQAPTTPKVFVIESRQVEEPYDTDDGEWDDDEIDEGEIDEGESDEVDDVESELDNEIDDEEVRDGR